MPAIASLIVDVGMSDVGLRQGADGSVRSLEKIDQKALDVQRQLSKIEQAYSGRDIIQQATLTADAIDKIGGTSKLTRDELERAGNVAKEAADKMKALGQDVPQKLEALAQSAAKPASAFELISGKVMALGATLAATFTVGAVVNAIERTGEWAGHVDDLSKKMGVSYEAIQRLDFAAKQNGQTIDGVSTAVTQLSKHLVNSDTGAVAALDRLGLSFDQLKAMSPDQAFIAVGNAIDKLPSKYEQNATSLALLGRSGAELISMFHSLQEDMGRAVVVSDDVIKAGDKLGDSWDALKGTGTALMATTLAPLAPLFDKAAEAAGRLAQRTLDVYEATRRVNEQLEKSGQRGFSAGGFKDAPNPAQAAIDAQLQLMAIERIQKIADDLFKALPRSSGPPTSAMMVDDAERMQAHQDALAKSARDAATAAAKLDGNYQQLLRTMHNDEGMLLMQQDADALADALGSGLMPQIDTLNDALEELENKAGKVKLVGLWAMPNAGPNQNVSDQTTPGFFGRMAGGFGNSMKSMWEGMSKGNGVAGLFSHIGSDIVSGGLNSLMNAGVSLLTKGISSLVGKLFGGEGKKTNDERDSWIEKNFGSSDQLRKLAVEAGVADSTLRELFSTKKVSDFERIAKQVGDQIHGFSDDQAADQERLQAAIEKYGFTLEQLPQKMQQSKLDDIAKNLIEDWRVLLDNGFDLDTVNQKMTDSVNEYLQMALRTASEVPAAMRPMLQKFLEQGLLTDENGNKITDLEAAGVHFAESMTQGFDRVVQKLQELIEKLHLAGDTIANMPTEIPMPSVPDPGPKDPLSPVEGYATGTGGRYLNFGSGRMVMLHGRERVSTENEGQREGGGLLAEMRGIRAEMRDFPRAIKIAIQDAKVLAR
jgi:hypothetical protein